MNLLHRLGLLRYARIEGCRFAIQDPGIQPIRSLLISGVIEKPERTAIRRYLNPSLPVIELGGGCGVVACITNKRLKQPGKHVVIEANRTMSKMMEVNRGLNQCIFTIIEKAIGYGSDAVDFHVDDEDPLGSSTTGKRGRAVRVKTTTLGEVLQSHNIRECTLVCDIEGSEASLIAEEGLVLAEFVRTAVIEVHERMLGSGPSKALFEQMSNLGFQIVDRIWETYVFQNMRSAACKAS